MAHFCSQSTLNILVHKNGLILTFGHKVGLGVRDQTATIYTGATNPITIVKNIVHSC